MGSRLQVKNVFVTVFLSLLLLTAAQHLSHGMLLRKYQVPCTSFNSHSLTGTGIASSAVLQRPNTRLLHPLKAHSFHSTHITPLHMHPHRHRHCQLCRPTTPQHPPPASLTSRCCRTPPSPAGAAAGAEAASRRAPGTRCSQEPPPAPFSQPFPQRSHPHKDRHPCHAEVGVTAEQGGAGSNEQQ